MKPEEIKRIKIIREELLDYILDTITDSIHIDYDDPGLKYALGFIAGMKANNEQGDEKNVNEHLKLLDRIVDTMTDYDIVDFSEPGIKYALGFIDGMKKDILHNDWTDLYFEIEERI